MAATGGATKAVSHTRGKEGRFRNPGTPSPNCCSGRRLELSRPALLPRPADAGTPLVHSLAHLATMRRTMCNIEMHPEMKMFETRRKT